MQNVGAVVEHAAEAVAAPGGRAVRHPSLYLPSHRNDRTALERYASPPSMSFWTLPSAVERIEEAGFSAVNYRLRLQQLLAAPLLFMAMAVAAASGNGASEVLAPENGFTSINPPLEPSRGGPLTTRSTHPWTFHALRELLSALSLSTISVHNPYGYLTKGELVA